jgi:MarR family transcriptional regulator, organic hydroperoxide resistance regulator
MNPLALESQVCFGLAVAARRVIALYRPVLEPMGLTHPQYLVMLALWQHEPLSNRRLSELLSLEPATMSPLLKRLEALGYVTRQRDPKDVRNLSVSLTSSGRALRDQALQVPPAIMRRLGMNVSDLQALNTILTEVIRHTQNHDDPRHSEAAPEVLPSGGGTAADPGRNS